MRKNLLLFALLIGAHSLYAQLSPVFQNEGVAIRRYDPVSYFKEGKPVIGLKEYMHKWNGANWYFSSIDNKELFQADPERYAPQYGGYCAYGTADGHKAPTQPDAWSIVDGKLYLNYNKTVQSEWKKRQAEYIKKADLNWPTVRDSE